MREAIEFSEALNCAVGKSKICEGQGLFALKRFAPTEIVVDYSSSYKKWKRCLFKDIQQDYKYWLWWVGEENKEYCRLADLSSLFMRANHSFYPNTEWLPETQQLLAKHTIFAGEEITYNYTLELAPDYIKESKPDWLLF